jgi:hypothetical protein
LAVAIVVGVLVYVVLQVASAVMGALRGQAESSSVSVMQAGDNLLVFLTLGLFVALAIMTPIWLARTHRNAETLSGEALKGSSGWTAGAWFIPLVGGALAAQPVARIWKRSVGGGPWPAYAWAILWSAFQVIFVLVLVVSAVVTADKLRERGGPPLPDAEMKAIGAEIAQVAAPLLHLSTAAEALSGLAMAWTVWTIAKAQRSQARTGSASPGAGWAT